MCPIILKNSHSHSFAFTTEQGELREVTVQRGQDIENLGIPQDKLNKLMREYVVALGGDGSTERPRYEHEDAVEETGTYTAGPVTQRLVQEGLAPKSGKKPLSAEEMAAEQAKVEAELVAEAEAEESRRAEVEAGKRAEAEATKRADEAEAKMAELEAKLAAAEATTSAVETPAAKAPAAKDKPKTGK